MLRASVPLPRARAPAPLRAALSTRRGVALGASKKHPASLGREIFTISEKSSRSLSPERFSSSLFKARGESKSLFPFPVSKGAARLPRCVRAAGRPGVHGVGKVLLSYVRRHAGVSVVWSELPLAVLPACLRVIPSP